MKCCINKVGIYVTLYNKKFVFARAPSATAPVFCLVRLRQKHDVLKHRFTTLRQARVRVRVSRGKTKSDTHTLVYIFIFWIIYAYIISCTSYVDMFSIYIYICFFKSPFHDVINYNNVSIYLQRLFIFDRYMFRTVICVHPQSSLAGG